MKKKLFITLLVLLWSVSCFAAGTITQSRVDRSSSHMVLVFTCTADAADASFPNTDITDRNMLNLKGSYIYRIIIENDSGDTSVTDNSDVYLYDAGGTDILNGEGVDQLDDDTRNYIRPTNYDPIVGTLTLAISNNAVNSGVATITIIAVK